MSLLSLLRKPPRGSAARPDVMSNAFADVERYVMFLGYPRSGHSLVGALLNAHPEAVIAHELDALEHVGLGIGRERLYEMLLERDRWFTEQGSKWFGYDYRVPGQWQGRYQRLRVIGDKKGGKAAIHLRDRPGLLDELRRVVGVPLRIIHVVRNPYDNIATLTTRSGQPLDQSIEDYFMLCSVVHGVLEHGPDAEFLTIRHEQFVADPCTGLRRLGRFIGLQMTDDYIRACASIVFPSPSQSRHKVLWSHEQISRVADELKRYAHLGGYAFADDGEGE